MLIIEPIPENASHCIKIQANFSKKISISSKYKNEMVYSEFITRIARKKNLAIETSTYQCFKEKWSFSSLSISTIIDVKSARAASYRDIFSSIFFSACSSALKILFLYCYYFKNQKKIKVKKHNLRNIKLSIIENVKEIKKIQFYSNSIIILSILIRTPTNFEGENSSTFIDLWYF